MISFLWVGYIPQQHQDTVFLFYTLGVFMVHIVLWEQVFLSGAVRNTHHQSLFEGIHTYIHTYYTLLST